MAAILAGTSLLRLMFVLLHASPCQASALLEYYILEESPAKTDVGNVVKDHLDQRYNSSVLDLLRFSFLTRPHGLTGDGPQLFTIDERKGIIRTAFQIDREEACPKNALPQTLVTSSASEDCMIKFDVAVQPMQFFEIIKVRVEILDVNDNSPTFPQSSVHYELPETTEPGNGFHLPVPEDKDTGNNAFCVFQLVPPSDVFKLLTGHRRSDVQKVDLKIALVGNLDRESVAFYQFTVIATDSGDPPRSGSILVNITITDVNDNGPQFDSTAYEVEVSEDAAAGTVVFTAKARDPDLGVNGDIIYSLAGKTIQEHGHMFGMRSQSGQIYTKDELNYESTPLYKLYIVASDATGTDGSLSAHALVEVKVKDVNDNAPEIRFNTLSRGYADGYDSNSSARFTSVGDVSAFGVHVIRTASVGTFVAHASIDDADSGVNGQFECGLVGAQKFELQQMYSNQFKIVTTSRLDRDQRGDDAVYNFYVVCQDNGRPRMTSSVPVSVKLVDENLHVPRFTQESYVASVTENNPVGQSIVRLEAIDRDKGPSGIIAYSLIPDGDVQDYIEVDSVTGVVTAKVSLDRERTSVLDFVVVATDSGYPVGSTSAQVSIVVSDMDDERPVFERRQYSFVVAENRPAGSEIGAMSAIDGDTFPFNQVVYSLSPVDDKSVMFGVDPSTGRITTLHPLDRESEDSYRLIGIARPPTDTGVVYTAACNINVYIDDVNDNKPEFEFPTSDNDTIFVQANDMTFGYVIGQVKARDRDEGLNAKIVYSLEEASCDEQGASSIRFQVDSVTGIVTLNSDFQWKNLDDTYECLVTVTATDCGDPPNKQSSLLKIVIQQGAAVGPASTYNGYIAMLANDSLPLLLAFALATLLVALLVILVIAYIARKDKNRKRLIRRLETDEVETEMKTTKASTAAAVTAASTAAAAADRISYQMPNKDDANPATHLQLLQHPQHKSILSPSSNGNNELQLKSMVSSLHRAGSSTSSCGSSMQCCTKPVVVFIKDLASGDEVGSLGSDTNSDSGRGPSSEDGDVLHLKTLQHKLDYGGNLVCCAGRSSIATPSAGSTGGTMGQQTLPNPHISRRSSDQTDGSSGAMVLSLPRSNRHQLTSHLLTSQMHEENRKLYQQAPTDGDLTVVTVGDSKGVPAGRTPPFPDPSYSSHQLTYDITGAVRSPSAVSVSSAQRQENSMLDAIIESKTMISSNYGGSSFEGSDSVWAKSGGPNYGRAIRRALHSDDSAINLRQDVSLMKATADYKRWQHSYPRQQQFHPQQQPALTTFSKDYHQTSTVKPNISMKSARSTTFSHHTIGHHPARPDHRYPSDSAAAPTKRVSIVDDKMLYNSCGNRRRSNSGMHGDDTARNGSDARLDNARSYHSLDRAARNNSISFRDLRQAAAAAEADDAPSCARIGRQAPDNMMYGAVDTIV